MSLSKIEVIRQLDFFEPLDSKIVKQIAQQCFEREFAAGDYVIRQGEPGLGLYFITAGKVKVEIDTEGRIVQVAQLQSGAFLGELSIVDEKARSASVVCLENTQCLLLTRDSFSKLMNKHPEILVQMVKALARRIRETNTAFSQPARSEPPAAAIQSVENQAPVENDASLLSLPLEMFQTYTATKGKVRDLLVDAFAPLYAMKTLTRFSMAVIGCPVRVEAENGSRRVLQTAVHDVKVFLFPARRNQTLRLEAFGSGNVSATVLRPVCGPSRMSTFHVEGRIRNDECWRLHVPSSRRIWMEVPHVEAIGIRDRR